MAMVALRHLVRSRTIECDVPVRDSGSAGSTMVRRSTLGNRDLSAWLVERG
jgi:endonuclease YncB( thermonuclease family)